MRQALGPLRHREFRLLFAGRLTSYDALGSFVAIPVGQLLAGPLAAAVGVETAIWIAVGTFLVAEASVLLVRDVRRLERTDLAVSR